SGPDLDSLASPAVEGQTNLSFDLAKETFAIVARKTADRLGDGHPNAYPERHRQQIMTKQPPRPVDDHRDHVRPRRRPQQLECPTWLEDSEIALPRAGSFGEDYSRHAAAFYLLPELSDRHQRLIGILAVDDRVAAAAEIVGDARNPARELALGDILRKVGKEERPENRHVEHALVVGDDHVGGPGLDPGRTLDLE